MTSRQMDACEVYRFRMRILVIEDDSETADYLRLSADAAGL